MEERHRLLFELGRGGMGTVFLAVSRGPAGFEKLKVVKRLRADLASDPQFLQMFLEEARLSARLSHPNVVQTNEVGFDLSHYFLEMEYLEGQTLDAVLRAAKREGTPPLPAADALYVLSQVLEGLHYAHELTDLSGAPLSVVHRDVSPHNVFVTYDGAVKVLDFGIAKAADSSIETRTGVVKGKVAYMAPEQATRRSVDRRADVFAAGVILWQVLTGRRLWNDLSEGEIFVKLERGQIPAPSEVAPDVPDALDAICRRAMAPDPDARFATAADFQRALDEQRETIGERAGVKSLAPYMRDAFAERRAWTRQRIEAKLRDGTGPESGEADVPALESPAAYAETKSRDIAPSVLSRPRELSATRPEGGGLRAPSPRGRGWRRAGGAALVFGALAITAVVARRAPARTATEAATQSHDSETAQACTSNAQCVARAGGAAALCRRSACVEVASHECSVMAEPGDVENERTLWLGAMFPLSGPDAESFGRANANAADLARRDFATMTSGLPGARVGDPPRPVALVMCDDATSPARAADHLVHDLGVPAVIGFHRSKEAIDLASSTFIPAGVVEMSALNASPLVTRVPEPPGAPRLVWRSTVSSSEWAVALARVVSDAIEPELRARGVLGRAERMRVALARSSNSATLSSADALFSALRINGESPLDSGASFRQFVYGDRADEGAAPDYAAVASALAAFRPHVVLYIDGDVFTTNVLGALEAAWPEGAAFRPRYATGGPLASDSLYAFIGKSAARRRRFYGVDVPARTAANVKFAMRYDELYSPKVTPGTAPGVAYDAFYALAYAAYAAGDAPVTGARIASGIARLVPPGAPIDVGPARIFDAFEALRAGGNIDLQGAATRLDFDLATGETASDFSVYCVAPDETGQAGDAVESGLVYHPGAARLEGTARCP